MNNTLENGTYKESNPHLHSKDIQESLFNTIEPFYLPVECNPKENFSRIFELYKSDTLETKYNGFSKSLFPVHGTTIQRGLSIIQDKFIYAHNTLATKKPSIYNDRLHNATDKLDVSLGLDKYVFLNVGRVNPGDVQQMYFCFGNNIIQKAGSLVTLKEIVHYGGLVSQEAEAVYKMNHPDADTDAINKKASKDFLENVLGGKDFARLFPYFLQKEYPDLSKYQQELLYPGLAFKTEKRGGHEFLLGIREGPQLQIPTQLDIHNNLQAILITSCSEAEKKALKKSVYAKLCVFIDDILGAYNGNVAENFYMNQQFKAILLNMTLRDIEYVISQKPKNLSVTLRDFIRSIQ